MFYFIFLFFFILDLGLGFSVISQTVTARNTLKIKETFPNLQDCKIKQVQKIINNVENPKPRINMMSKGLSCKQVIIPMSIENAKYFIRESSMHVININRTLKDIKSNIMADFIHIDSKRIIISTNNIACPLDLQEIEKYVKNLLYTVADQIEAPKLP